MEKAIDSGKIHEAEITGIQAATLLGQAFGKRHGLEVRAVRFMRGSEGVEVDFTDGSAVDIWFSVPASWSGITRISVGYNVRRSPKGRSTLQPGLLRWLGRWWNDRPSNDIPIGLIGQSFQEAVESRIEAAMKDFPNAFDTLEMDDLVSCPSCLESRAMEDWPLTEACKFKCPTDGTEFEIIVKQAEEKKEEPEAQPTNGQQQAPAQPQAQPAGGQAKESFTTEASLLEYAAPSRIRQLADFLTSAGLSVMRNPRGFELTIDDDTLSVEGSHWWFNDSIGVPAPFRDHPFLERLLDRMTKAAGRSLSASMEVTHVGSWLVFQVPDGHVGLSGAGLVSDNVSAGESLSSLSGAGISPTKDLSFPLDSGADGGTAALLEGGPRESFGLDEMFSGTSAFGEVHTVLQAAEAVWQLAAKLRGSQGRAALRVADQLRDQAKKLNDILGDVEPEESFQGLGGEIHEGPALGTPNFVKIIVGHKAWKDDKDAVEIGRLTAESLLDDAELLRQFAKWVVERKLTQLDGQEVSEAAQKVEAIGLEMLTALKEMSDRLRGRAAEGDEGNLVSLLVDGLLSTDDALLLSEQAGGTWKGSLGDLNKKLSLVHGDLHLGSDDLGDLTTRLESNGCLMLRGGEAKLDIDKAIDVIHDAYPMAGAKDSEDGEPKEPAKDDKADSPDRKQVIRNVFTRYF